MTRPPRSLTSLSRGTRWRFVASGFRPHNNTSLLLSGVGWVVSQADPKIQFLTGAGGATA